MVGIGPNAEGEFHPEAVRQIKESGKWLAVNGEAIYATRSRDGLLYAEGDAVRFTRTKDNRSTYAIVTEWPGREVVLKSVRPKDGSKITMLGSPAKLDWTFDSARGTVIRLPESLQDETNRPSDHAWSFKIQTL
jgi:alpha-L-fucosidase